MKTRITAVLMLLLASTMAVQSQLTAPPDQQPWPRFAAVDVFVNSGDQPLAAFQFELRAKSGLITVVGVEEGEHDALQGDCFYFDRPVIGLGQSNRVIVGAFTTAQADALARGKQCVATIHVMIDSADQPVYDVQLEAAATNDGRSIPAELSTLQGKTP